MCPTRLQSRVFPKRIIVPGSLRIEHYSLALNLGNNPDSHYLENSHVRNLIQLSVSNNIPQLHNMYTPSLQTKLLIYKMRSLALA